MGALVQLDRQVRNRLPPKGDVDGGSAVVDEFTKVVAKPKQARFSRTYNGAIVTGQANFKPLLMWTGLGQLT